MKTAHEIFKDINEHQIVGIMVHTQLASYYDFLDLHGFKRLHEYHALREFVSRRGVERYYINHYNRLLMEGHPGNPRVIPEGWMSRARTDVDKDTKRRAVRDGIVRWVEWEISTKKLYEAGYKELCEQGEVAAAIKIKELVEDVDRELKHAQRLHIKLESIGYDLPSIYLCQDALHEKYKAKAQKMGVDIC